MNIKNISQLISLHEQLIDDITTCDKVEKSNKKKYIDALIKNIEILKEIREETIQIEKELQKYRDLARLNK